MQQLNSDDKPPKSQARIVASTTLESGAQVRSVETAIANVRNTPPEQADTVQHFLQKVEQGGVKVDLHIGAGATTGDIPINILTTQYAATHLHGSWKFPQDNQSYFVGRTDLLDKLKASFGAGSAVRVVNACKGLGGVGKTELAIHYAYHNDHGYKDRYWFTARTLDDLNRQYYELGIHYLLIANEDELNGWTFTFISKSKQE